MQNQSILFVGYGKIASRLANALCRHNRISAMARSPRCLEGEIKYIQVDLTDGDQVSALMPKDLEFVVVCLSPSERSETAYRATYIDALANVLAALGPAPELKRLLFVSSTSIYHQDDGSSVNETSEVFPVTYSGKVMAEAEALLEDSVLPTTSVRFSGIYGGSRSRLIEQVCSGAMGLTGRLRLSNRIHEDDCVGFLAHLMALQANGEDLAPRYLASDSCPVDLDEVITFIAQEYGAALTSQSEPAKRRAGNKRCDNSKMRETGYELKFPSYREGYSRSRQSGLE